MNMTTLLPRGGGAGFPKLFAIIKQKKGLSKENQVKSVLKIPKLLEKNACNKPQSMVI